MKKIIKWIGLTIAIIAVLVMAVRISEYNSLVSKNTRNLEMILSENITSGRSENGNLKDLITLDYDKMYVFGPYQPIDEMEKQIGFKYSKLKEGLNEGIVNILLVKDNKAIAYLFGYPSDTGYYLEIPSGEYTKSQIDRMTYTITEEHVGNSYGTPKTYIFYELRD